MVSRATPNDGNTYTVLLDSATVRDQNGRSRTCARTCPQDNPPTSMAR
jgi:hypothetical protein